MSRNRTIRRVSITAAIVAATALTTSGVTTRPSSNDVSNDLRRAIDGGRAKNVILFLGDGMGDSEITIARNYQVGANGRLWMDALPFTGEYTTYALQESNPQLIDYVTDSAASGTGWATGFKTSNGRISVGRRHGKRGDAIHHDSRVRADGPATRPETSARRK